MFSRTRCVWALFSLKWDSPFNKASHNVVSEDVANHVSPNLHHQNKKSGRWGWDSSILRMPDLAKPNVIIPSWKGEMGTKGSLQLWLISFPLPEAEKEHAFQTPEEGPKADFSPGFGARRRPAAPCCWLGAQPRAQTSTGRRHRWKQSDVRVCAVLCWAAESLLLSEKSVFPAAVVLSAVG